MEREGGRANRPAGRHVLLLVAVLLVGAAAAVRVRHMSASAHGDDPALHGDVEEATMALGAILDRTPVENRVPLLVRQLGDPSPGLRHAAINALAEFRGPAVANAVEASFGDWYSEVRQRALEVLPAIDRDRGFRMLLAGLRDSDTGVRQSAAMQLNARSRKSPTLARSAVPHLIRSLDDPDHAVVAMSATVLRRATGKSWHISAAMSPAQAAPRKRLWNAWWVAARPKWKAAPEYAGVASIAPTRSDAAPVVRMRDLDGNRLEFPGERGRITLLNFWGSWCPQCVADLPALLQVDREYRDRNVRVVGIAVAERGGAGRLRDWCRAHGVGYAQALAREDVQAAYGDVQEVPVTYLIDGNGRIRSRWDGDRDYATYRSAIDRLLAERPATRATALR